MYDNHSTIGRFCDELAGRVMGLLLRSLFCLCSEQISRQGEVVRAMQNELNAVQKGMLTLHAALWRHQQQQQQQHQHQHHPMQQHQQPPTPSHHLQQQQQGSEAMHGQGPVSCASMPYPAAGPFSAPEAPSMPQQQLHPVSREP